MSYQLYLVHVCVPKEVPHYDLRELPGHVEVELPIGSMVTYATWRDM